MRQFLLIGFGMLLGLAITAALFFSQDRLISLWQKNAMSASESIIGRQLNPAGDVPAQGFKAIYFESAGSNPVPTKTFEETVDTVAINFGPSPLHDIKPRQFGAYWVGRLKFDKPTIKTFTLDASNAYVKVFVDGKAIKIDEKANILSYDFPAGEHYVEVEFLNRSHTVSFKVTIQDEIILDTYENIASFIKMRDLTQAELYYGGIYESNSRNMSTPVHLPHTNKPIVLWLSSYHATEWEITAPRTISAVILSSFMPGSQIKGADVEKIFYIEEYPVYTPVEECACLSGRYFNCETEKTLIDLANYIKANTGLELEGYAMGYNPAGLDILPYNDAIKDSIKELVAKNEQLKKDCSPEMLKQGTE